MAANNPGRSRRSFATAVRVLARRAARGRPVVQQVIGPGGRNVVLLMLAIATLATAIGMLGAILDHVLEREWLTRLDSQVYAWMQAHRTPVLDGVFATMTWMGEIVTICILLGAAILYLLVHHRRIAAAYTVAAAAVAELVVGLFKVGIGRARPTAGLNDYSFPSGHTTMAVVAYVLLGVLLLRGRPGRWQALGGAALAMVIAVVATSRIYLGVHWFSDVAGGVALAAAVLSIFIPAMFIHERLQPHTTRDHDK